MSPIFCFVIAAALATAPTLSVDANAARHPISNDIYGMNFAAEALAKELGLPVNRWGGDAASRYNWQVNVTNAGADYYYIIQDLGSPTTPSADVDAFVAQNVRTGTKSVVTIPLIPYLTKGRPGGTPAVPYACSYAVPAWFAASQFDSTLSYGGSTCGSGSLNGNLTGLLSAADRDALNIANSADNAQGWIAHLTSSFGTAAAGGVALYMMDNEPSLWQSSHPDIYPVNQLTYDALVALTEVYAPVVKATDPAAQVLGPSDWGYSAYFDSPPGYALQSGGYAAHGNTFFGVYYLQQMQAYQHSTGVRILDYFDEHYYPQAVGANGKGIALNGDDGDPATQALRLRAVRSLWDPSYTDESWIAEQGPPLPTQLQLIPMFRQWVTTNYPGTKLSLSEYNFGALDSMNGALAQADVLGVFGREQLDLASIWSPPASADPGAYAFRMYRNYDGAGGRYGDTSVQALSSDQGQLAIYAAERSSDGALTLILINKTAGALSSPIALANFTAAPSAQGFLYSGANLASIEPLPAVPLDGGVLSASYPANSITLWVVASGVYVSGDGGTPIDGGGDGGTGNPSPPATPLTSITGGCSTTNGVPSLIGLAAALLFGLRRRVRAERS